MSYSVQRFISELIRAANQVDKLTCLSGRGCFSALRQQSGTKASAMIWRIG